MHKNCLEMYDMRTNTGSAVVVIETPSKHSNKRILRKPFSMVAPALSADPTSSGSYPQSNTTKKGVRGMLGRSFPFGLKRSFTPMKQRRESNASDTAASLSTADFDRAVRFAEKGPSRKICAQVFQYESHDPRDVPLLWYTETDMRGIITDVKSIVRHYQLNCEKYNFAMDQISVKCATAPETVTGEFSLTDQFDARVLEQLSNAAARGLESHIAPRIESSRKEIVRKIVEIQDELKYSSLEEKEQKVAELYTRLARPAKLVAKTMADGDAMVAKTLVDVAV
jgi:hypothetical protein